MESGTLILLYLDEELKRSAGQFLLGACDIEDGRCSYPERVFEEKMTVNKTILLASCTPRLK
jgi:hypothetical protein